VLVGDAAVTRLYKDGVGSAFVTAEAAARAAIERGVSRRDFAKGYAPVCERIARDNEYGRVLFRLWELTRRLPLAMEAWRGAILAEADRPSQNHIHTRLLWGMFTGDESYRRMFWQFISPAAIQELWQGLRRKWSAR
jgi:flavin-dependent dehydrogenase